MTSCAKSQFASAILILLCSAFTFAQDAASPVSVKLSIANGKDVYRAGETIRLILSFTTDRPGFDVQTDRQTYLDKVLISPKDGLFDWKTDYYGGEEPGSDASSFTKVSAVPGDIKVSLNDYYRFDGTGKYTVQLITKRVREKKVGGERFDFENPIELTTNTVSFEVKTMSDAEEATEAKRLGMAIESAKVQREQIRLAEELANLSGDAAIPEKIACYLRARNLIASNYGGAIYKGLFLSRNRALMIKKLEVVLNDLSRRADFEVVGILSSLRARERIAASGKPYKRSNWYDPSPQDDLYAKASEYYLKFVIDSLPKRQGKNLNDTAFCLLWTQHNKLEPDLLASVRGILLKNFDSLDIFAREQLLGGRWEQIRDPSLIPSLERMLKATDYPQYGRLNVHTTALKRLSELDQIRARPFVILDISDTNSLLYDDAFDNYKEVALPEVDQPLLADITKYGQSSVVGPDSVRLRNKCLLVARFATVAIYEQLMDVYRTNATKWEWNSRAILLGYFARYNAKEALALVESELTGVGKEWRGSFLNDFTRVNYSPEVAQFVEKRLALDDPEIAGEAAYLISQHGSTEDRSKIESRLKQWQSLWERKYLELEGPQLKPENTQQAQLQVSLIMALLLGKEWKLSDDDKKELRLHCLTETCKQAFHW